jgi:hypothetical protein
LALTLDDLQLVLLSFIATLFGVLFAFLLTAIYDRMKKRAEEREERRRMLTAIQKELQVNRDFLTLLHKDETYTAGQMFLWKDAYQSAVNSGKIVMLDPKLQNQLGVLYLEFKQLDVYGGKILAMLGMAGTSESKTVFETMLALMKRTVETTLKLIPKGLEALEAELKQLDSSTPPTKTPPMSRTQNPNPNRDIDLLKVNLAADYRLGMLVGMIGVYFALIVGLLVAWYETFASKPNIFYFYYTGIALIVGILGAMLITQELIPYKNWLKQVDGWLRMIENNQRVSDLIKLVPLPDRVRTSGHFVLILLMLLDFYLTILGYPSVELFLGFSAVGITVAFLTGGGVALVKKWRAKGQQ